MKGALGKRKFFPVWNHKFYAAMLYFSELQPYELNNRHCKREVLDCFFEIWVQWCFFHNISYSLKFIEKTNHSVA